MNVSVLMAGYNHGHFVDEAIQSVLNQTLSPDQFEIIFVDDGSTDDTAQRVKKYGDKIRYFARPHGGQAAAFNFGITQVRGEITAFLDADDAWTSDKLETVARDFQADPELDALYHYLNYINIDREVIGSFPNTKMEHKICAEPYTLETYLKGRLSFFSASSGTVIRTEVLKKIAPIPGEFQICADGFLQLIIPFFSRKFTLKKSHLGHLRIHTGNSWSEKPPTVDVIAKQIHIQSLLIKHLDRLTPLLDKDTHLLRQHMKSVLAERGILRDRLQGKKWQAFKEALFFEEFPLKENLFYRMFRKAALLFSIILPYTQFLKVRRAYQNSPLFTFMHRGTTGEVPSR